MTYKPCGLAGKRRRGISGLMQVAMIVGMVIIFGGVLFVFAGDIFDVQTVADSVSVQRVFIQRVGGDMFVSANIKNTGNNDITSLSVQVMTDVDPAVAGIQPFVVNVTGLPLAPGITGSVHDRLADTSGGSILVPSGTEVGIVVRAVTSDGSELVEPVTVRAR